MSFAQTTIGVGALSTILVAAVGAILPGEKPSKPALEINKIEIYADGSTYYDRTPVEGAWIAWSGQIFKLDGTIHCRGGDLAQYFGQENPLGAWDVDYLLGDSCIDGLQEGMTYKFTWTPLNVESARQLDLVRYPDSGYGRVLPAR